MPSTKQLEAERASQAYQIALSAIGARTIAEALVLWQSVPVQQRQNTAHAWLDQAVHLVMSQRSLSADLARAYYRLVRALFTGHTVADPLNPEPKTVPLSLLREQFQHLADVHTPNAPRIAQDAPGGPGQANTSSAAHTAADGLPADDEQIILEELAHLEELEREAEAQAEEEARIALEALGTANLDKQVGKIDTSLPATEVDAQRQAAHDSAGARQAAAASRIAMNGGRTTSWIQQEGDKRAIGYVRVSLTGTPCGWCAMLISRGPVYRSAKSAGGAYDDGDKYHDNCHCIAVPVFSEDQYANSPMFNLNREYAALWPKVTQGLGGESAVSAWRRFIRTQQATPRAA